MIELKDLRYSVQQANGSSLCITDIKSLVLKDKSQTTFTGASGSGKTTLLHLISGLLSPAQGSITINGTNLCALPMKERDRWRALNVGYVFQNFYLLPTLNALENVCLPAFIMGRKNKARVKDEAAELLAGVGLAQCSDRFPHQMSNGEQQRTAIARALINKPPVLLADEPTASLDSANSKAVVSLLISYADHNGSILIVATHDPAVMERFADRFDVASQKEAK